MKNSDWDTPRTLGLRQLFKGSSSASGQDMSPLATKETLESQGSQFTGFINLFIAVLVLILPLRSIICPAMS